MNIFVGNLSWDTTDSDLNAAFSHFGTVSTARIATERDTGRARGFGFVEMESEAEAQTAISALNGSQLQGRTITVNESKPREAGSGGGGNRGGYSSGGGGGGRSRW